MFVVDDIPDIRLKTFICQYHNNCPEAHIHQDLGDASLFLGLLIIFIVLLAVNLYTEITRIKSLNNIQKRLDLKLWRQYVYGLYQSLKLTSEDRLTIYIFCKETDKFFKVARYSLNEEYKNGGRMLYSTGLIKKAFNETRAEVTIISDPDVNFKAYVTEVNRQSNIKKEEIKKFKMLSRYLYAQNFRDIHGSSVGVILLETTNTDLSHLNFDKITLEKIFTRETDRIDCFLKEFPVPEQNFIFEERALNV